MGILPIVPLIVCALLLFAPSVSDAELYKWVDEDNVLHVVDSLHKIPEKYRDSPSTDTPPARLERPETPGKRVSPPRTTYRSEPTSTKGEDIFGGKPIAWWKEAFKSKRDKITELKETISDKKNFISIFERGRRLGQIYDQTDISSYDKYKSEIPKDEKEMASLEKELKALTRKARSAGVPKSVRRN